MQPSASKPVAHAPIATTAAPAETKTEDLGEGELESKLERYPLRGDGIEIEVSWWTLTGNTHVADEVVIKTKAGTLQLRSDDETDEPTPLIEEIYPAGKERWVLLGWSSFGEGMQTEHAWLVDGSRGEPRVVDKLEWTTDRSHAGLAIDPGSKPGEPPAVGIPLPHRAKPSDEDEMSLHNELDWRLAHGRRSFTLARVEQLPATKQHLMSVRPYMPPTGRSPTPSEWSGRFVWFSVDKKFVARRSH